MSDISRGSIRVQGFKNEEMDFQLMRQLGASAIPAASVGECLNIANQMKVDTPQAWVEAFSKLAEWQKADGLERLTKNHLVSGRQQLFKACNSFRAAEYYASCATEYHRQLGLNSASCFVTAIGTTQLHFEEFAIPYKNIDIPVYFISPQNDGEKRKTILIVSGFDGTLEEEFFMRGFAAVERNYNVIHFAGPGQMDVFRKFPDTFFEPDFEEIVKRVIDFFAPRSEINMNHLSLMGISVGGYFATRAACFEPRLKALIANSPILDVHAYLSSFVGSDPSVMPDQEDFTLEQIPQIPDSEFPPELKVRCEQLMIRYGRRSFKNTFQYLKKFRVGDALNNLQCPALALIGESEGGEPMLQFEQFCTKLNASHYKFSNFEGAGSHCQVGNNSFANAIVYDWLDSL